MAPWLAVDPTRVVVTAVKPSDDGARGQAVVRLWETSGRTAPLTIDVRGYRQARAADLLERERERLVLQAGRVAVSIRGLGFAAVTLTR